MRFRLQGRPRTGSCTTLDHVYPSTQHGEPCYCGERRWGIIESRGPVRLFDDRGRVYRPVWKLFTTSKPRKDRPHWVYVCAVRGCGHVIVKTSETKASWIGIKVRCRMCERIFRELEAETARQQAIKAKQRARDLAVIKRQLAGKRLVVRVPKGGSQSRGARSANPTKSKQLVVTVKKAGRGRGGM